MTDDAAACAAGTAETIFALSSGRPPAGIAVMRISGPAAGGALERLAGRIPPPRRASLRTLRDPRDGGVLDHALILWFPEPATATGEDLAELHLHGGRAVIAAVSDALAALPGMREAQPGEFTRRAFLNGRIDLAAAEGLADLLTAETEAQRRAALAAADGALGREIEQWRMALLTVSARVEAMLDFADEGDVPDDLSAVRWPIDELAMALAAALRRPPAERLRDGLRVVIAGPPNAGKSTLLNALAGRDAAIVSPVAGTTRDRIDVPVSIAGVPLRLIDTAGLRTTDDAVEALGIDRAAAAVTEADILLWLGDSGPPVSSATVLRVYARADLPERGVLPPDADVAVSASTGRGIETLIDSILQNARKLLPREDEATLNRRQRTLLSTAAAALERCTALNDPLLLAEELRHARAALDAITGRAGVEDMLDALFGAFCIGK